MERLLYISQAPHLENIRAACEAGCKWIQLRVKENPDMRVANDAQGRNVQPVDDVQGMKGSTGMQSVGDAQEIKGNTGVQSAYDAKHIKDDSHNARLLLAIDAKKICDEFGAKLSINDHPAIAAQVNAYGVHVGKLDVPVKEARSIAGDQSWLGGTANTIEDVLAHVNDGVDYVGVGPFRFTTTKEKLSPILGLEGYQQMMAQLGSKVPVLAIGGILLEDIPALKEAGVYGVAVSGLITHAVDKKEMVQKINAIWNH